MSARAILITGAGGYVGAKLAERVLEATSAPVILWVHGQPEAPPEVPEALARFGTRVRMAAGELADDRAFAGVDPAEVAQIVHAAAVTRFNVEAELADRVNVGGTARLLAFADRCPALEHLTLVSTVYVAGLQKGHVPETELPRPSEFANHYERSKWEGERLLLEKHAHLSATIARVATVIADDDSGAVTQRNAVHNTLRLLYHGLLSLVPGDSGTPVYFVTGQLVVDALAAIVVGTARPKVVHVSHAREESGTLGDLVDVAFEVFHADEAFRARRLLKPELVDAESFEMLVDGIDGFGGDAVRQALASVAPFARQLFSAKLVERTALATLLPGNVVQPPDELVRRTVAHLVRTRWGRVKDVVAA